MAKIFIRFEYGVEDKFSDTFGPFEYVQAIYNHLVASPDGETELAHFYEGFWWTPDCQQWSDYVIFAE